MNTFTSASPTQALHQRLPLPYQAEANALAQALSQLAPTRLHWPAVVAQATPWVQAVRQHPAPFWALDSLLKEFPLSSAEGLALMRLAEALLRVPDAETAIAFTADQLGQADFSGQASGAAAQAGAQTSDHAMLAKLSTQAIALAKHFLPEAEGGTGTGAQPGVFKRLGARTVVAATVRAIQLLGRQFVLGRNIAEALREADAQRRHQPASARPLRFSFDMLGEGARTDADAQRYQAAYAHAIATLAERAAHSTAAQSTALQPEAGPAERDGISIKLSALHPRYEVAQRERVLAELVPRVWQLVRQAAQADINLTIDAEEVDRLELSLEVLEALAARLAQAHPNWRGFGLAVQAYQTRALAVVAEVVRIAQTHGLRLMVRLVKGAYWDAEIKRAQELGLAHYPVFTQKQHTDASYLACAAALLAQRARVYAQFATHNAGTIAAVAQLAAQAGAQPGTDFEMQRLHGMGEGVYREVLRQPQSQPCAGASDAAPACRVYAPVGEHRDLLAYLVRRLLENGANSSFVHQLADAQVAPEALLASPLLQAEQALHSGAVAGLPLPPQLYGPTRANAAGWDVSCPAHFNPLLAALATTSVPSVPWAQPTEVPALMARLQQGFEAWQQQLVPERAAVLRRAGDALEQDLPAFCALLVQEAHKTWGDAVAEVREAIDFCRYYAAQAEECLAEQTLPGPTGERNTLRCVGRGVWVCISPWNFPLAIFAGQVVAALVAGNAVAAKPAEQTPAVAARFVALLHAAGVPADALAMLHGPGETIGAALVADERVAGVCFTGSTQVAKHIQRALAAKDGPIVPLIAETGGLNAMLVDSTALPEQVVDAVVQSAFRSAGQRCSALRLLCVHEAVADAVLKMLAGAMAELRLGAPAELATDVGPVIDANAHAQLSAQVQRLEREAKLLARTPLAPELAAQVPHLLAPVAFELERVGQLKAEIFGPVLHIVRWGPGQTASGAVDAPAVLRQVNALGYGLTFGLQTRMDGRAQQLAHAARVGNVYVNRNMVGAVVGVQPFGGEGLSGTGPKAGGPHYLYRFCAEQTVSVNTAAAGGNVGLLTGGHTSPEEAR